MGRKIFADLKTAQLNREGKGKPRYNKVGPNEAACETQTKVVGAHNYIPKDGPMPDYKWSYPGGRSYRQGTKE